MTAYLHHALIEIAVRHLPPSAAALRVADLTDNTAAVLTDLRPDCTPTPLLPAASATHDALIGLGDFPPPADMEAWLPALRPGGRLIWLAVEAGSPNAALPDLQAAGERLTDAGYVRVLTEALPGGAGLLLRGERAHTADDTAARIAIAAHRDAASTDLATYRGRFLFLLVRHTPNVPPWAVTADVVIAWSAAAACPPDAAVNAESGCRLLVFTSLPNAVAFMQPAVTGGLIRDIHRIAKFPRAAAGGWPLPILLNPPVDALHGSRVMLLPIDATSAITGEE